MEWIKVEDKLPKLIEIFEDWGKSKEVVVLVDNDTPLIAEYSEGVDGDSSWEQWYCPAYGEVLGDITVWCDCIPNF